MTDPTSQDFRGRLRGRSTTSHRTVLALIAAGVAAASCSSDDTATTAVTPTSSDELAVTVASFDLSLGDDQRFLAGVLTPDRQVIGGGTVDMAFTHLGDDASTDDEPRPGATDTASFLPVPGTPTPTDLEEPVVLGEPAGGHHLEDSGEHSDGGDGYDHEDLSPAGVYETTADFHDSGFWEVTVTADVGGKVRTGTAVFEVQDDAQVPEVGDPAPRTSTLTLDSAAPAEAIDSRAGPRTPVPDEILHQVDLVDALDAGRPVVVLFSTPTYCTSRFCGPITEAVEEIAREYGDRAAFVHVEIWNDIDERRFNDAVEDWLVTDDGGHEPWVFLVDADGTIAARWDNVLDVADLTSQLEALPAA